MNAAIAAIAMAAFVVGVRYLERGRRKVDDDTYRYIRRVAKQQEAAIGAQIRSRQQ